MAPLCDRAASAEVTVGRLAAWARACVSAPVRGLGGAARAAPGVTAVAAEARAAHATRAARLRTTRAARLGTPRARVSARGRERATPMKPRRLRSGADTPVRTRREGL